MATTPKQPPTTLTVVGSEGPEKTSNGGEAEAQSTGQAQSDQPKTDKEPEVAAKKATKKKRAKAGKVGATRTKPKSGGKKVNKSEAIRVAIGDHPDAGPTELAAILKKDGIDAALGLISNVKSRMGKGKKTGQRGRPKGSKNKAAEKPRLAAVARVSDDGHSLVLALALIKQAGSAAKAKNLIDQIADAK